MALHFQVLKVSPVFHRFLERGGLAGPELAIALQEVAREAMGSAGIFVQHFSAGQGAWAPDSADTVRRKGGESRVFFESGGVWDAINRQADAGSTALFGSSADKPGGLAAVAYNVGGMYVRIKAIGGKTDAVILTMGFAGDVRHSKEFNKIRKTLKEEGGLKWRASISRTVTRMKEVNAQRRARTGTRVGALRKWAKGGTLGFKISAGGKQKYVKIGEKENVGYANIVQRGEFKGILFKATGLVLSPTMLGNIRAGKGLGGVAERHGTKTAKVTGTARPLLPFTEADEARITAALERGVGKALAALRVQAAAVGVEMPGEG